MTPYDDDFPTCRKTFSTLRIFSDTLQPEFISTTLGITPTDKFVKGDLHGNGRFSRKFNGWLLSSEHAIDSKDSRKHVNWLVSVVANRETELKTLREMGAEIDISCLWISSGQGGPIMSPLQMKELCRLELEIWWDIYFEK